MNSALGANMAKSGRWRLRNTILALKHLLMTDLPHETWRDFRPMPVISVSPKTGSHYCVDQGLETMKKKKLMEHPPHDHTMSGVGPA